MPPQRRPSTLRPQRDTRDPAPRRGKEASRVLAATLEYDGTRYRGWQAQINARTVQGTLYGAVTEVLGEGVRIFGSGRTDAGVHAFAQVASLHLSQDPPKEPLDRLRQALNDRLPPDIHVLSLVPAAADFHARHSASARVYRYRISRRRTAFGKPYVWWVKDPLDVSAMADAATVLLGRHDYSSFCENAEGHESTLVEVSLASVTEHVEAKDLVLFRIGASHFLWKMVRRIVGTLVEVGTGRLTRAGVEELLKTRSGKPAEWTAPPSGLFLESVSYPNGPAPPEIHPLRPAM